MIPIGDNLHRRRFPLITFLLIGINLVIFLFQLNLNPIEQREFFYSYGLVPALFTEPTLRAIVPIEINPLATFFTSMFLHGNFGHLAGNMWALWIFGDNVEDQLGSLRFLLFYILSGLGAGIFHFFTNFNSTVPTIGASGALAGVMGAFMLLFPGAKIITLVPIFFFFTLINIPALLYMGFWFLIQLYFGAIALGVGMAGGIAWWAHIGGFIIGIYLLRKFY